MSRQHQHRAGVDLRGLEQPRQGQVGDRDNVGCLGQLKGQAAQTGRGATQLRQRRLVGFVRLQKLRLAAAVRDRGRLVNREHARVVNRHRSVERLVVKHVRAATDRAIAFRECLRQIVDEAQLRLTDPDNLAGFEQVVAPHAGGANHRAVTAVEVSQNPLIFREKDFRVAAAASLVLDHNLIRGRTADRNGLPRHEPKHVRPFRAFTNDQVRKHRSRSLESATSRSMPARMARRNVRGEEVSS